jgi:predicted permease
VGAVSALPLSRMYAWGPITVEGRIPAPGEHFLNADVRIAAGDYFQAMRIPLRSGRWFAESDIASGPRVAIVDEFMAAELWPNQDAIGKRFHNGASDTQSPWITVVGVVGRVKQYTLEEDSRIAFYLPQTQYPTREMTVVVRGTSETAAVRRAVAAVDPDLPMYQVRTMNDRIRESLAQRRLSTALAGLFAGLALLLAAIGTYGVMSFLVQQGLREMGIRLAVGATPGTIRMLVLRRAGTLAALGIAAGLAGALALTRLLRSQVFGIGVTDPLSFVAGTMVLAAVAMLASYIPARRASRVDPMISLREG